MNKNFKRYKKFFIRQHGEFSCGLACLAMIVKYYGGNARQESIRNISGTTIQGTTLLGLYQAAGKLNLKAEAYEAGLYSLKSLNSPAILHVIKNHRIEHYIVCFGFIDNQFIIGDPAESNITTLNETELNEIWQTKTLLTLEPNSHFEKQNSEYQQKYQWLKNLISDDMPLLTVSFILGLFIAVLGLTSAVFSQKLIDDLLPSQNFRKIILGIGLFFLLLLFRSGLDYLRSIFMLRQSRNMNNRLVDSFFAKILYLPKSFFDSVKTGEIITRMSDSRRIQQTVAYITGGVLIEILVLLFSIVYLLFYSWKMALIAAACMPFFALLVYLYNDRIVVGQRSVMAAYAMTESQFIDFLQGVNDIKMANKQPVFRQIINVLYGISQELGYRLGILGNQYGLLVQLVGSITSVSLIVLGVWWVVNGQLKLGELMAIMTIGNMIISSTASLSSVNIRLQEAGVAFDRFYEFIKAGTEFEEEAQGEMVQGKKEQGKRMYLQINNLSFRFTGRKKLFDNISMEIKTGEIVTLFGEIGSGKSTLIQILQKHYLPESGEIVLNGKSITGYPIPVWRELIGAVSQQIKIFNGNVGENICLGNFMEERQAILQFCNDYGFDTFFRHFPQGLDTLVGEDGVNLSDGQQQLIALARALYRKPSILLLDEPTSAMDTQTEKFVMDLLIKHKKQFATLLVTHRKHLAEVSDKVYQLKNGGFGSMNHF
ncbi:MAG: peptidase domain-containing ABC transporter [Dysgonamonadaceae bacterium]|jgi:ATP-binding cassette subfamily B protein|nr:peptidase domain-containing ABC transporter [Dysgonamonadaceae bacterium]